MPPNLRAVLVDTKGPEIRTGKLQGGVDVAEIVDGSVVTLTFDDVAGDKVEETGMRLHVDYPSLAATVQVGLGNRSFTCQILDFTITISTGHN